VIELDALLLVMLIEEPFFAVNVPEFTIAFVPENVNAVLSMVKLPTVAPLFWLVMVVGLPLADNVQLVNPKVPPVLVIVEPASILKVVALAVKVALTLFVIGTGLPFKLIVDEAVVVTVPELVR